MTYADDLPHRLGLCNGRRRRVWRILETESATGAKEFYWVICRVCLSCNRWVEDWEATHEAVRNGEQPER